MKKILLFTTIFASLALSGFGQKTKSLTNADKTQIIQSILLDNRFDQRFYLTDEERLAVYLSTENVSRNIVPSKVGEAKILLKSPQEIEKEKKNWDNYCAFGKFETDGSKVIVSFYRYVRDSETGEFDREILEYEHRKAAGKWKFVSRKHPGLRIS